MLYGLWLDYAGPNSATFGADGLVAYTRLFLWGIASDIVNQTLQTIRFSRAAQ